MKVQAFLLGGITLKEKIRIMIAGDNQDFIMTLMSHLEKETDM